MEQENVQEESFSVRIEFDTLRQEIEFQVIATTTVAEIKRVINENSTDSITCYQLFHSGKLLKDFATMSSLDFSASNIITFQQVDYLEYDIRIHLNRFREMTSFFTSNVVTYGLQSGLSFASRVDPCIGSQKIEPSTLDPKKFEIKTYEKEDIESLIPPKNKSKTKCYKNIQLSKFKVPNQRKLKGDLIYLCFETLDNDTINITCHSKGFYKNSTIDNLNCLPFDDLKFTTLVDLLSHYSPSFKEKFELLHTEIANTHPFEYFISVSQTQPWLIKSLEEEIIPGRLLDDCFQAIDCLDTLQGRDWNDDIQSARELPKNNGQERVERDQACFRSHADFVDAALKAAIMVVNGSISPINPLEDELSQMYLHNNIFLSEGYDNKQIEQYGGLEASHVAISKDIDGISLVEQKDLNGINTLGTIMVDYRGHRIVAQSIVPGILKKAENDESSILYGSVDGGLEIISDESFVEKASILAKALHLKKHTLIDQGGKQHGLVTSVETKWVNGTDSRGYCLDLYRVLPVDACFLEMVREDKDNVYPHEMVLLRSELIEIFYEHKARSAIKAYQDTHKNEDGTFNMEGFEFSLEFNPDVFTYAKLGDDKEEIAKDEELVREASGFIQVVIGQIIIDLGSGIGIPVDTCSLTKMLHQRGVNMRYLGQILSLFEKIDAKKLDSFRLLLKEEMVARSVKKLLRNTLSKVPIYESQKAICDLFNCLFALKNGTGDVSVLQKEIQSLVKSKFRYELTTWDFITPTLLRSICLKVGIQIECRKYDFASPTCFVEDDILNLYPIVKEAIPRASLAQEAHHHGRMSVGAGEKETGMQLIKESISLYEQIYGPIHEETGKAYANLAMLSFNNNDIDQSLITQRRTLICLERTNGVDDPETLKQYVIKI
jgi:protein TIF31